MILHNKAQTPLEGLEALERVWNSGQHSQGPETEALEADFCAYTGRKHAIAVDSGTSALRLAYLCRSALNPVVPAYSCVALANPFYSCSQKLGVVDVIANKWTLDPRNIPDVANSAVISVNTFGVAPHIVHDAGITIEDCTHGFSEHKADIEVLSLHATKLFGGAAGGMILTDIKDFAEKIRDLRDYDDKPADGRRLNCKTTDLHSCVARVKLARIASLLAEREELANEYIKRLVPLERMLLLILPVGGDRTWYRFTVHVDNPERTQQELWKQGVQAERPIEWWPAGSSSFRVGYHAYEHLVSLPLYPGLGVAAVDHVCKALAEVLI